MSKEEAKISICGYTKKFPALNLELMEENIEFYEAAKIAIELREAERGFKVKRFYKTGKSGTSIVCEAFKTEEEVRQCISKIEEKMKEFNEKYDNGFKFNLEGGSIVD